MPRWISKYSWVVGERIQELRDAGKTHSEIAKELGVDNRDLVLDWTKKEDTILRENYSQKTDKELSVLLGRPHSSVRSRRVLLHLSKTRKVWSEKTDEELRKLFDEEKTDEEIRKILGFNIQVVRTHRVILKLRRSRKRKWSKREDDYIKENWKKDTNYNIAKELGLECYQIERRSKQLGLQSKESFWNPDDYIFLKKLFEEGKTDSELMGILGKGEYSIKRARQRLGLKRSYVKNKVWNRSEEEKIIELKSTGLSSKEISLHFPKKTLGAVNGKIYQLNLPRKKNIWKSDEIEKLEQIFPLATNEEFRKVFPNRSLVAIRGRGAMLGLKRIKEKKLTNEAFQALYSKRLNDVEIAKELGLSSSTSVSVYRNNLKLPRQRRKLCSENHFFNVWVTKEMGEFLDKQKTLSGYIRGLIEADMRKSKQ